MSGQHSFVLDGEQVPVVWSYHAKERIRESNMSLHTAYYFLCNAEKEKNPMVQYKRQKYHGNNGVKYLRYGSYIFTGKQVIDKRTNEPIFIIITFTDQRVTLPA